jgi:hypothetical protein
MINEWKASEQCTNQMDCEKYAAKNWCVVWMKVHDPFLIWNLNKYHNERI